MEKILVAVDASPAAKAVLQKAVAFAQKMNGTIVLFRAVSLPVELPMEAFVAPQDRLVVTLQQNAEKEIGELSKQVPVALLSGSQVALGTPWQAICEAATQHGCSLIVIGSHSYGLLDRLLGSTAAKVVNHAEQEVLVVRPPRT